MTVTLGDGATEGIEGISEGVEASLIRTTSGASAGSDGSLAAECWSAVDLLRQPARTSHAIRGTGRSVINSNPAGAFNKRGAVLTNAATVA